MDKRKPVRTCIGCNTAGSKNDLLRMVRQPDGSVIVDISGSMNGRGAYICRDIACFEAAVRRKAFNRTFGRMFTIEETDALRNGFEQAVRSIR